jgi:hypothetical protein
VAKVCFDIDALLPRLRQKMDMYLCRAKPESWTELIMTIKTLIKFATFTDVQGHPLPRSVEVCEMSRASKNVVTSPDEIGDSVNRVNGMHIPATGGTLPPVCWFIVVYDRYKSSQPC